ncbi:MAG: IS4 family transposase [Oligoflexus sp.]
MVAVACEFNGCNFGDSRLVKRAQILSSSISRNPELSIHAACASSKDSKAAYRFFQNENVTPSAILSGHISNTLKRAANTGEDILVIQDTTDLIYSQFPSIEGLGERHKAKNYEVGVKGILLHNTIAVTRSGIPLGLLKQTFFTHDDYRQKRNQVDKNIAGSNKKVPFEEKESYRWVEHFRETDQLLRKVANRVIHVADRECDIFEFLYNVESSGSHYVVRSKANRMTQEGPRSKDTDNIQNKLDRSPALATLIVSKENEGIECELRSVSVILKIPQRLPEAQSETMQNIKVSIVEVKSKENSSKKLHWRLLTNLPCSNDKSALNIVEIYKQRWSIECFHRVLKSGFGVEKARLASRKRLENLASLLSIVSWYIFWLYNFGRAFPTLSAQNIFDEQAIEVLKISSKKLKVVIRGNFDIRQGILILARLGGFAGRKNDGEPGMINIWRGWRKLQERIEFMEELT